MGRQPEGFHVMQYQCQACGGSELIWNSRDAVTPFIVRARCCEAEAHHVNWRGDVYAPRHVPDVGDRVFVTATPDIVRPRVVEMVEKFWDHGDYPMSKVFDNKEEAIAKQVESWCEEFGGRAPAIVEVDESWRAMFEARAMEADDG